MSDIKTTKELSSLYDKLENFIFNTTDGLSEKFNNLFTEHSTLETKFENLEKNFEDHKSQYADASKFRRDFFIGGTVFLITNLITILVALGVFSPKKEPIDYKELGSVIKEIISEGK